MQIAVPSSAAIPNKKKNKVHHLSDPFLTVFFRQKKIEKKEKQKNQDVNLYASRDPY